MIASAAAAQNIRNALRLADQALTCIVHVANCKPKDGPEHCVCAAKYVYALIAELEKVEK